MKFSLKKFVANISGDNEQNYSEETISILRLIRTENVGTKTFYDLMKLYNTAENAVQHVAEMSVRGGKKRPINVTSKEDALSEIDKLQKMNAHVVTYKDSDYPKLLSYIFDAPPILNYIGRKELFNTNNIAIVGARNASLHGKSFAFKIARELTQHNITIVSGLARGIDTSAHEASIPNTIAVVAGGIDNVYPTENTNLHTKIAKEGLIVAELPIGSNTLPQHFPQRNRIISGISLGVMVVEATMKSGSLITAKLALEQNREVFATPGFPMDPRSQGTNYLIKSGAYIVESVEDIIGNLGYSKFQHPENQLQLEETTLKHSISGTTDPDKIPMSARKQVEQLLSIYPVTIDSVLHETKLSLPVLYTIILEMELAGRISRHPGNKVALVYN